MAGHKFNFGNNQPSQNPVEVSLGAAIENAGHVDFSFHEMDKLNAIEFMESLCKAFKRTYEVTEYEDYFAFSLVPHADDKIAFTAYVEKENGY